MNKKKLTKMYNDFINSPEFKQDNEQTMNFLEWRDNLQIFQGKITSKESEFLTSLYYED